MAKKKKTDDSTKKTKPTKRRIRSPHPGVKLKKRVRTSGNVTWRAHFVDPHAGREVALTLDPMVCGTHEARRRWAIAKSRELAQRKMDAAAGIKLPDPDPGSALEDAITAYLVGAGALLKPKTIEGHNLALAHLRTWARRERIIDTAELTRAKLISLREHMIAVPRSKPFPGGRAITGERRSPVTVNRELRSLKTILNDWRQRELLPELHRDDIADSLKALPVSREQPAFLLTAQIRKLIASALRHDEATFLETREEHAGERAKGTTIRYDAIAPFLVFLLLSGMRRGEALRVTWNVVHLDAVDHEGRAVGEIRLGAKITKTDRARTIGLEVSPMLRRILAALRLRDGGKGHVFGGLDAYTVDTVEKARRRMVRTFGAPVFDWQTLRSTCATYLTNASGIFGAATAFMSAKQLGHSIAVAERHYLGVHRGIPRDARTLEAAMQVEKELSDVLGAIVVTPSATGAARAK